MVRRCITCEQMAAILCRYSEFKGGDVSARADLSKYNDAGKISGWAVEAMSWANAGKIINGTSDTLIYPGSTSNRAQVAAVFHRFIEMNSED